MNRFNYSKLKNLIVVLIILFLGQSVLAKHFVNPVNSAIKKAAISRSALISVSVKDISNSKTAFELNSNTPMTPASIQKLLTILPSINTLGKDYEFKTQLYKNADNNLFIKLSADPYFTTADLKGMIKELNSHKIYSTKAFYIDDSVLDSNDWGEGWQWDDDMNPLMPKFSAYNIDKNLVTVSVCPTVVGAPADISTGVFYPTAFINNVITSDKTDVKFERKNYISPDVIDVTGTISHDLDVKIPVNYPRRYFILRLEDILRKQKVAYYGDFNRLKLPKDVSLVTEVKRPIAQAQDDILKESNNLVAETVFKVAGGKYAKETGSISAAKDMFNDYYKNMGINTDNINIVDGSGVSKNNLVTANFVSEVLIKASKTADFCDFQTHMAYPGCGTLTDRMLYFKDNLKAKTGTLSNISSIAGYITAKSGKKYAFCIIINDSKSKSSDKKAFEEYVLRTIYDEL